MGKKVGAEGMGIVYRAVDLTLRRPVAIKALPRMSPVASLRLRREARAIAAVNHPNLAMIFGAQTWKGTPMLVFEFLEGGSLRDLLKRGQLPYAEALQLGITLADVLDHIHGAGILHRDIKPGNIGFTATHVPKLMDFGLARIFSWTQWQDHSTLYRENEDPDQTLTVPFGSTGDGKGLAGTPLYLSPEAIKGLKPSPLNDLWALAITLFESLAGAHPLAESYNRIWCLRD